MGFLDVLGKVASALLESGMKSQADSQRRVGNKIKEYERKIDAAESSPKMNNAEYAARVSEAKHKLESAKVNIYTGGEGSSNTVKVDSTGQVTIGGKTVAQWEGQWRPLGILSRLSDLSQYSHSIGLYKGEMDGKIYYIGRAIEHSNGGLRKRLHDYTRNSDSGRIHTSGNTMNENADNVYIHILVMGNSENEVEAVKALEKALVMKYAPPWNVQFNR